PHVATVPIVARRQRWYDVRPAPPNGHDDLLRRGSTFAVWCAVAILLAYLGLLLARAPEVVNQLGWDSDAVSPMVIAETIAAHVRHGSVILGSSGLNTLLADVSLRHLPGHRALWVALPWVVALATVASLLWSVRRAAGRGPVVTSAILALAACPALLQAFGAQ